LLDSLQDELFSNDSDDDDDSAATVADYLQTISQSLSEDAEYSSISLEA